MSTPTDLENAPTIPLDLTGKVNYETADTIEGGHARICKGVLINSDGTTTAVRLLLPSHCGDSVVTSRSLTLFQVAVKVIVMSHNVAGKVTSLDLQTFRKVLSLAVHQSISNVCLVESPPGTKSLEGTGSQAYCTALGNHYGF